MVHIIIIIIIALNYVSLIVFQNKNRLLALFFRCYFMCIVLYDMAAYEQYTRSFGQWLSVHKRTGQRMVKRLWRL